MKNLSFDLKETVDVISSDPFMLIHNKSLCSIKNEWGILVFPINFQIVGILIKIDETKYKAFS